MINFSESEADIIIVDDEQSELDAYSFLLQAMGVKHIKTVNDSRVLMDVMAVSSHAVVFLDLNMPHKSGEQVLAEIKEEYPHVPVIICTANSDISMAVKCLKLGALRNEIMTLKGIPNAAQLKFSHCFSSIITCDAVMHGIFHYIESIAGSGQPVLVLGETGSGKELIARAIHDVSQVPGEFVTVDVAGIEQAASEAKKPLLPYYF